MAWNFDNSYSRLPQIFFTPVRPEPVSSPHIWIFNQDLAYDLGIEDEPLRGDEGAAIFAGNQIPKNATPIALAYAGHQFGYFTMLGDGRAVLLGEHLSPSGKRFDIQLKGSGRTPYSRGGDGRASLGPMVREYIISEAMHSLDIPTTRSLAVASTGDSVFRGHPLPGAVLTRVAASHLRVGTFEYIFNTGDHGALKILADYAINRHFPELQDSANPYLELLRTVINKQASLIAKWLGVGFIHGVMNTDNMAISGETIDYGPCAFMDFFDPDTVFSSIDHHGRYAFGNQPHIAQWNLARFAETLLPLLHLETKEALKLAEQAIEEFPHIFDKHQIAVMEPKLGLAGEQIGDKELIQELLHLMKEQKRDYTQTFRSLTGAVFTPTSQPADFLSSEWLKRWDQRLANQAETRQDVQQIMRKNNPVVIPRNHRVEEALQAAVEESNLHPLQRLLEALEQPYAERVEFAEYAKPPETINYEYQTFCGT